MPLFKNSKKSREPSQHLAFGVSTHVAVGALGIGVDLDPEIGLEGVFRLVRP